MGATKGCVYPRSEYPNAEKVLNEAIAVARKAGVLGKSALGSQYASDMEVRVGAGAYVCGLEAAAKVKCPQKLILTRTSGGRS